MADNIVYNNKPALPNKLLNSDGSITDLIGNEVVSSTDVYNNKPALPNKFLNPDGSYSTLNEILSGAIDVGIYVIVEELPTTGDSNKIYLVPKDGGGFVEWHYHDGEWDTIGELEIDLSNYYTKSETDTNFLKKNNTTAYTPAQDYNPATKKYVDDAIQNSILDALGGEY